VSALPCDVLLTVHPDFADLDDKRARMKTTGAGNPFIDATACSAYAKDALRRLEARLASEK